MKIGIYTLHSSNNFGAQLQSYALQKFLEDKGYEVEFVNYVSKESEKRSRYRYKWTSLKGILLNIMRILSPSIRLKISREDFFNNKLHFSSHYDSWEAMYKTPPEYDIHLVGSDQVWNIEKGFPKFHPHFLEFLPDGKARMSYASSFGTTQIDRRFIPRLRDSLQKFNYLSVREKDGVDLVRKITGKDVQLVVDPTFLLSSDEWIKETNPTPLIKGEYILCYGCVRSEYWARIITKAKELLDMPVVAVSTSIIMPYDVDKFFQSAGPREFLNLFYYASYVITGSFHGLAFSLNFRRNFVVVRQGTRMSRMESLLKHLEIDGYIIQEDNELIKLLSRPHYIDYEKVSVTLSKDIEISKEWLTSSLNSLKENNNACDKENSTVVG